jgi:2-(1,2-epoxy-1,2-dihydrophenyl)acetyl-CoA isomerase
MNSDAVKLDVEDGLARVTLTRPQARNAWDDTLGNGMTAVFAELAERIDVRCVLLAGEGPVFCAGADLMVGFPTLPDGRDDLRTTLRQRFHPGFLALLDLPQPVVAAIHGPAIGAGACLALASDIALMSQDTYLQFRFAKIGLMPDVGATALLAGRVGPARAAELLMLADPISGPECAQLGLVSRAVPAETVLDDALSLARRLATGPTQAYATTKRALRTWSWRGLADQLELEASLQQTLIGTADWAEGRTAFQERREPRFTGR